MAQHAADRSDRKPPAKELMGLGMFGGFFMRPFEVSSGPSRFLQARGPSSETAMLQADIHASNQAWPRLFINGCLGPQAYIHVYTRMYLYMYQYMNTCMCMYVVQMHVKVHECMRPYC